MVEPTALPTDVAGWSSQAAMTDTLNSGAVVARLTRVAPTTTLGIPVISATPTAPSVNQSAPFVMMRRPAAKMMKFIQMENLRNMLPYPRSVLYMAPTPNGRRKIICPGTGVCVFPGRRKSLPENPNCRSSRLAPPLPREAPSPRRGRLTRESASSPPEAQSTVHRRVFAEGHRLLHERVIRMNRTNETNGERRLRIDDLTRQYQLQGFRAAHDAGRKTCPRNREPTPRGNTLARTMRLRPPGECRRPKRYHILRLRRNHGRPLSSGTGRHRVSPEPSGSPAKGIPPFSRPSSGARRFPSSPRPRRKRVPRRSGPSRGYRVHCTSRTLRINLAPSAGSGR